MRLTIRSLQNQFAVGVAAMLVPAAAAQAQIIPLEQDRSISAFVIVPQCGGDDGAFDAAEDFRPFESTAFAILECELAAVIAVSTQASSIGSAQLTAAASSTSDALALVQNVVHSIADSLYEVTFELEGVTQYALTGIITAEVNNANFVFAGTIVTLRDADNVVILEHAVEGTADGKPQVELLADEGLLESGVYTLRANTFTGVDNDVPPNVLANAFYEMAFLVTAVCLADLNGDGDVGPADLALLLGNWGPVDCAGAGCPDFNQDGEVNAEDLAVLLGHWGLCP